jgi:hypothetical protein
MDQASFSLKATRSSYTESESKPQRAGYLQMLLAMLRHSRRQQTECILRQHAALFERAGQPVDLTKLEDR